VNLVLDGRNVGSVHNHRPNSPAAFPHPEHGSFADRSAPGVQFFAGVLVLLFSADECPL
jgi:hypothetical protein